MRIVWTNGCFDIMHPGHIELFKACKTLGDRLIVIVNNDEQAKLKKGKSFMNERDRLKIVESLKCVDEAFLSIDKDESVCLSLRLCAPHVFANGGDRKEEEVPEAEVCRMLNIEMVDGLGDKIRSSSDYTGLK